MDGTNGAGGMNGMGGAGVNGMMGMNGMNGTNGMNGGGGGGILPPPPSHLGMDQVYNDPHSQQYMTDMHHTYHQPDYGHTHSQVAALPLHGPGGREEIWMNFMHQLTTPDGHPHQNGYQPQMGYLA